MTTIADLHPDPANARKHNPRNVGMIEKSLQEVGAARSIVIDEDGTVLAGNGVLEAAASAGIERVQIVDADGETIVAVRRTGLTADQKRRLALYDNRTGELAEWDAEVLAQLATDDAAALAGLWGDDELAEVLADAVAVDEDTTYSRKVVSPVYEPSGECPLVADLCDDGKVRELVAGIEVADLTDDVRALLLAAAQRHRVFNYRKIADFYAHADAGTQDLMERSALIIIDFDKAIEYGFVQLSDRLTELAARDA